jgi:NAD(P)-dependent dehydrogenase (short-subunit alcohol dehydrogenase family)
MTRLNRRVAVVTGSTRGIGFAIAERLASEGAAVVITGRTQPAVDAAVETLRTAGHTAVGVAGSVANESDMRRTVETAFSAFGRLDVMVNNAGIVRVARIVDTTTEEWQELVDVNLTGVFFGCREAARRLIAQGEGGRIINISSIGGRRTWPYFVPYGVTKFGVVGLSQGLAAELGPHNITVNCVCPGNTETAMWTEIDRGMQERYGWAAGAVFDRWWQDAPLGRGGAPTDVASAVAFLASDDAAYITGQALAVDGGLLRL